MGQPDLGEESGSSPLILPWPVDRNCTDRGKDSQRLQVCCGLPRGYSGVQLPEETMIDQEAEAARIQAEKIKAAVKKEREEIAAMVELMGIEGFGTLYIATAIRARGWE